MTEHPLFNPKKAQEEQHWNLAEAIADFLLHGEDRLGKWDRNGIAAAVVVCINKANTRPTCPGCKQEIDPDTCHCGDPMDKHTWGHGHSGPLRGGCC